MPAKVTVRSDWGYFDQLYGNDLTDQEVVKVSWPDGSTSTETVRVFKDQQSYCDMGNNTTVPDIRAFITVSHRGVPARLYLRESDVLLSRAV